MPEIRHSITPPPTAGPDGVYFDTAGNKSTLNPEDPNSEKLVCWFTVAEMADYYDEWSQASTETDDGPNPNAPRYASLPPERQQEVEAAFKSMLSDMLRDFYENLSDRWAEAGL